MFSAGLDLGFGLGGSFALDAAGGKLDFAQVAAAQPDGKILIGGGTTVHTTHGGDNNRGILLRLNVDGSLDASFGASGIVVAGAEQADAFFDLVSALAVQPDGKIIAAGSVWENWEIKFAVARFNPDGTLDTSFGSGRGAGKGFATLNVGQGAEAPAAVIVAADGKVVVAGEANFARAGDGGDFGVARFNANGTPDTTFSEDGATVVDFKPVGAVWGEDWARSIAIDSAGNILLGGASYQILEPGPGRGSGYFALARVKDDGTLDAASGAVER